MRKRGNKPRPGRREPNGRLSRRRADIAARLRDALDREERETISVAVDARVRVLGVSPDKGRDQLAGSFVGRLCLGGDLTRRQYDAAMTYLADATEYRMAIAAPRPPHALDPNAIFGRGGGDCEPVDRVRRIVGRMARIRDAIQEAQNELRGSANLLAALDLCVLEDKPMTHLLGDLRVACNVLARVYKIAEEAA